MAMFKAPPSLSSVTATPPAVHVKTLSTPPPLAKSPLQQLQPPLNHRHPPAAAAAAAPPTPPSPAHQNSHAHLHHPRRVTKVAERGQSSQISARYAAAASFEAGSSASRGKGGDASGLRRASPASASASTSSAKRSRRSYGHAASPPARSAEFIPSPGCSAIFLNFCNVVLQYENYEQQSAETRREERRRRQRRRRHSSSPPGSTGSSNDSLPPSREEERPKSSDGDSDDTNINDNDSLDQVTCFCNKPFAGRPMVECSSCQNWFHLKCVHLRRQNIPEIWLCPNCKEEQSSMAASKAKRRRRRSPPPPSTDEEEMDQGALKRTHQTSKRLSS